MIGRKSRLCSMKIQAKDLAERVGFEKTILETQRVCFHAFKMAAKPHAS